MIEIDIISGFLGAGKTTLSNLLLGRYISRNERAVYIVNEFGQTSIDAELIRSAGFQALVLSGGCVCCTLKGELTQALKEIIQTFEPARIVFETSGIFVFDQFGDILRDEFLRGRCRIRRTVVVVDSLNYRRVTLAAGSFIENQIRNASVNVVSKLERFQGDIAEIVCDLKNINPEAAVVAQPWDEAGFSDTVLTPEGQGMGVSFGHCHVHMDAMTLQTDEDLEREAVDNLVRIITSGECGDVLRVKGFIRIEGAVHLLNIARQDVVLKPAAACGGTQLTVIGEHLKRALLERKLAECLKRKEESLR